MFIEFGADTTRTIASLIVSRASQRYPNIKFIFSHGGGVLTAVAERFLVQMVWSYVRYTWQLDCRSRFKLKAIRFSGSSDEF